MLVFYPLKNKMKVMRPVGIYESLKSGEIMIIKVKDYADDLAKIAIEGLPRGKELGWANIDELYRVPRGYLTVVTGIPAHGKSEVIDAFMVNLALKHDWKFAVYSPENYPIALHAIKLAEKFDGHKYSRIGKAQKKKSHRWVDDHFTWLYPNDDSNKLGVILDMVRRVKESYGCQGFVLDPWNEVDHDEAAHGSETKYIEKALIKVRRFAREHDIHIWIIAHPTKMRKKDDGTYDPPTPYDINGSSHWRNKADFCLCVHRHDMKENVCSVYVQKVKQKNFGKLGEAHFAYDWESGRISDKPPEEGFQSPPDSYGESPEWDD